MECVAWIFSHFFDSLPCSSGSRHPFLLFFFIPFHSNFLLFFSIFAKARPNQRKHINAKRNVLIYQVNMRCWSENEGWKKPASTNNMNKWLANSLQITMTSKYKWEIRVETKEKEKGKAILIPGSNNVCQTNKLVLCKYVEKFCFFFVEMCIYFCVKNGSWKMVSTKLCPQWNGTGKWEA